VQLSDRGVTEECGSPGAEQTAAVAVEVSDISTLQYPHVFNTRLDTKLHFTYFVHGARFTKYLTAKLRSTYNECLIYKTAYKDARLFLGTIYLQNRKIV